MKHLQHGIALEGVGETAKKVADAASIAMLDLDNPESNGNSLNASLEIVLTDREAEQKVYTARDLRDTGVAIIENNDATATTALLLQQGNKAINPEAPAVDLSALTADVNTPEGAKQANEIALEGIMDTLRLTWTRFKEHNEDTSRNEAVYMEEIRDIIAKYRDRMTELRDFFRKNKGESGVVNLKGLAGWYKNAKDMKGGLVEQIVSEGVDRVKITQEARDYAHAALEMGIKVIRNTNIDSDKEFEQTFIAGCEKMRQLIMSSKFKPPFKREWISGRSTEFNPKLVKGMGEKGVGWIEFLASNEFHREGLYTRNGNIEANGGLEASRSFSEAEIQKLLDYGSKALDVSFEIIKDRSFWKECDAAYSAMEEAFFMEVGKNYYTGRPVENGLVKHRATMKSYVQMPAILGREIAIQFYWANLYLRMEADARHTTQLLARIASSMK